MLQADGIATRFELGRARWPKLALDPAVFAGWLLERGAPGELPGEEHAADLYLACACANRIAGSIEAFEAYTAADLRRAVARVSNDAAQADEVLQAVREKLFLGVGDSSPKIGTYAGRGPLRRWVAAAGMRIALNFKRDVAHLSARSSTSETALAANDPELKVMKSRYTAHFEASIRAAFATLSARDKSLLQLHYWERLSVDRLGAMYKIARSTAARWVASSRAKLLDATRKELMKRANVTETEFDSIAALVVSDLDISMTRMFETLPSSRNEEAGSKSPSRP